MNQDYAADLLELASFAAGPRALGEILTKALDALRDIVPYDLAAVFELEADSLRLVAAEGPLASPSLYGHRLALLQYPALSKAMDERRPVAFTEAHLAYQADLFTGVLDSHQPARMLVPLYSGPESLGLIVLDRRDGAPFAPDNLALAGTYGKALALAMVLARQAQLLERHRRQLAEQSRLLRLEIGADRLACERLEASESPAMRELVVRAQQLAANDVPVLIFGELGTGKEALAQAMHAWSRRAAGPFVKLNCAALPENLITTELFGRVRPGDVDGSSRLLTANGGTLLLEEVADLPLTAQGKLLRLLESGRFQPLDGHGEYKVDVRVVASTSVALDHAVATGRFREDLYHRLAVFPVRVPPLRERPEDVATIAERHLAEISLRSGRGPWVLSEASRARLRAYPWPGNVRELINVVERAAILRSEGEVLASDLGLPVAADEAFGSAMPTLENLPSFVENERSYFERVLTVTRGKLHGKDGAAALVGLKPTTLQSRLKKLGIEPRSWKRRFNSTSPVRSMPSLAMRHPMN